MDKKIARLRRSRRTRATIRKSKIYRLCVFRTPRHMYVQLIDPSGSVVIASASTLEKEIRVQLQGTSNRTAAELVGKSIAQRALSAGIRKVAFDRSGYKYHGRVRALAEAANGLGLEF